MTSKEKSPLARRLAEYRKIEGYASPAELADAINNPVVTKSTITNLEQGRKSDISLTEACLIARALDIPVFALVCDISEPFGRPDLVGFETWRNADMLNLFTIPDGVYGPVTSACFDAFEVGYGTKKKNKEYLDLVYLYVRYLAEGLANFQNTQTEIWLEGLKPPAERKKDIDNMNGYCIVAQYNIRFALRGFERLKIEVPKDVMSFADKALNKEIPRNEKINALLKQLKESGNYYDDDDDDISVNKDGESDPGKVDFSSLEFGL
jgi:transcriptional regulator with XRE-family HTH domain